MVMTIFSPFLFLHFERSTPEGATTSSVIVLPVRGSPNPRPQSLEETANALASFFLMFIIVTQYCSIQVQWALFSGRSPAPLSTFDI